MSDQNLWYQRLPLTKTVNTKILTQKVRRRAKIGRSHWETSFASIPDNLLKKDKQGLTYKRVLLGYCKSLEKWEDEGLGVVLHGPVGTGKTALGCLILKYCLAKGGRSLFYRASDLVDELMSRSYKPKTAPNGAPLLIAVANVNYLMIDDLEIEKGERLKKLEALLRARDREQLPTIITTNKPKEDLFNVDWLKSLIHKKYIGLDINSINWRRNPPSPPSTDSLL